MLRQPIKGSAKTILRTRSILISHKIKFSTVKDQPKCFGLLETDLGNAICMELISGDDGQKALTVADYLKKNGFTPDLKIAIDGFCSFLLDNSIVIRDLRPANLVIRKGIPYQIYMVDGIGNTDFIPIADVYKRWGRKKIQRHINRFKKMINYPDAEPQKASKMNGRIFNSASHAIDDKR